MAKIEDLIDEIANPILRERIANEVKDLKETKRFGLVFEEHIPETVSLYGLPIRPGLVVQNRTTPEDLTEYQILSVEGDDATLVPKGGDGPAVTVDVAELLVVKRFHEQIFPGLTPVGEVRRGGADKPAHVVINGENFHTLQVLTYTHGGKVDCIYIDPPYNTGARDWKYNNRFVDSNDAYRHSKWLAMMERRLKLARHLLNPESSVLIATIDEKEYLRLGLLLEQLFPEARIQMITSIHNPNGTSRPDSFNRVDEYIFFVRIGSAPISPEPDPLGRKRKVRWDTFRRHNPANVRESRPNQFYPIYIDKARGCIKEIGEPLPPGVDRHGVPEVEGCVAVFPVRDDGTEMMWSTLPSVARERAEGGFLRVGPRDSGAPQQYPISGVYGGTIRDVKSGTARITGWKDDGSAVIEYTDMRIVIPTTSWSRPSHNARTGGTDLLAAFLPSGSFPFPKSLYAVADAIRFFVKENPEAIVLDFFAGSATTLHAVAMINAEDRGNRRCILVTNNDVSDADRKRLSKAGYFAGDPEFEAEGIFESVTKPRVKAAITGVTPDGDPVEGEYLDQYLPERSYSEGFEEDTDFFDLDYLDPDLVELGRQFNAIAPMLWMAAGSVGEWEDWDGAASWSLPNGSTYGVLFDEDHLSDFAEAVEAHSSITHVWLVTNSPAAFAEMRQALPEVLVDVRQLYRDYLRNFTVNALGVLRR